MPCIGVFMIELTIDTNEESFLNWLRDKRKAPWFGPFEEARNGSKLAYFVLPYFNEAEHRTATYDIIALKVWPMGNRIEVNIRCFSSHDMPDALNVENSFSSDKFNQYTFSRKVDVFPEPSPWNVYISPEAHAYLFYLLREIAKWPGTRQQLVNQVEGRPEHYEKHFPGIKEAFQQLFGSQETAENKPEIQLATKAKELGIRTETLKRWDRIKPMLGKLTQAQIAEREGVTTQTIKKDKQRMIEKGYLLE